MVGAESGPIRDRHDPVRLLVALRRPARLERALRGRLPYRRAIVRRSGWGEDEDSASGSRPWPAPRSSPAAWAILRRRSLWPAPRSSGIDIPSGTSAASAAFRLGHQIGDLGLQLAIRNTCAVGTTWANESKVPAATSSNPFPVGPSAHAATGVARKTSSNGDAAIPGIRWSGTSRMGSGNPSDIGRSDGTVFRC